MAPSKKNNPAATAARKAKSALKKTSAARVTRSNMPESTMPQPLPTESERALRYQEPFSPAFWANQVPPNDAKMLETDLLAMGFSGATLSKVLNTPERIEVDGTAQPWSNGFALGGYGLSVPDTGIVDQRPLAKKQKSASPEQKTQKQWDASWANFVKTEYPALPMTPPHAGMKVAASPASSGLSSVSSKRSAEDAFGAEAASEDVSTPEGGRKKRSPREKAEARAMPPPESKGKQKQAVGEEVQASFGATSVAAGKVNGKVFDASGEGERMLVTPPKKGKRRVTDSERKRRPPKPKITPEKVVEDGDE